MAKGINTNKVIQLQHLNIKWGGVLQQISTFSVQAPVIQNWLYFMLIWDKINIFR